MRFREVRFDIWCPKCKFCDKKEDEDPCDECMEHPVKFDSTKPEKFKEKK